MRKQNLQDLARLFKKLSKFSASLEALLSQKCNDQVGNCGIRLAKGLEDCCEVCFCRYLRWLHHCQVERGRIYSTIDIFDNARRDVDIFRYAGMMPL